MSNRQTQQQLSAQLRTVQTGGTPEQPRGAAGYTTGKGVITSALGSGFYAVDHVGDGGNVLASCGAAATYPRNTGLEAGDAVTLEFKAGPAAPPTITGAAGGGGGAGDSVVAVTGYLGFPEGA